MIKQAPSPGRIAMMAAFALSCFALLLFLWVSFGGSVPLSAQGYRVRIAFPEATQLAPEADVRIAGVNVGKVVKLGVDSAGNRTMATIELQRRFAPLRSDARATLRVKTLGGETYVQIAPGTRHAAFLRDGGMLSRARVDHTVELDEVLNALDPRTRRALRAWQQDLGRAIARRGPELNDAIGQLPLLAQSADDVLAELDTQRQALGQLVRNSGVVLRALTRHRDGLRRLVVSSGAVFAATAAERRALARTIAILPRFLADSRVTAAQLESFSADADPLVQRLRPAVRDLVPTLRAARRLAPDLRHALVRLDDVTAASRAGLPATGATLRAARPALGQLGPFLEQLNPVLDYLLVYDSTVSDFLSQPGSALNARGGHYLRWFMPEGVESAALWRDRLPSNRGNSYLPPLALIDPRLTTRPMIPSWDCRNTGAPGDGSKGLGGEPLAACNIADPVRFEGRAQRFPRVGPADYAR